MLKIVVFDSGYGGELFAEQLAAELPIVEIIRVIDWRHADAILRSPIKARKLAEVALRPYFGKVDLIIFANYMLSVTSLAYFRRKYKSQKFLGFSIRPSRIVPDKTTLIITTRATTKNLTFHICSRRLRAKTICLDTWPPLIDDGVITSEDADRELRSTLSRIGDFSPEQILLACGQFSDMKPVFRQVFGHNVRIVDSFDQTIRDACHTLRIRSPAGKH